MPKLLLLLVAITCLFTNCRKEIFNRLEIDLEGTWEFVNVSQQTYDAFATHQSIFSFYKNERITFKNDKTAIYTEANGDQLEGIWDLRSIETTDSDGDGSTTTYIISIALVDTAGDLIHYIWETNNTNINNYLRVEESTVDYKYCYELDRR